MPTLYLRITPSTSTPLSSSHFSIACASAALTGPMRLSRRKLSSASSRFSLCSENDSSSSPLLDYLDLDTEVESGSKVDTFKDADDK